MTRPDELEREYQAARFAEYFVFSRNVAIAGAVLVLGLWLRDYADDPSGAHTTLAWRVLMAASVALYAFSLGSGVRRTLKLAAGYVAVLTIEFVVQAATASSAPVSGSPDRLPGARRLLLRQLTEAPKESFP